MSVALPGCEQPILLPRGWQLAADESPLVLIAPEQDLRVALAVAPAGANPQETALQAWRLWDSSFSLPVLHQAEMPSKSGWDKVYSDPI